MGIQSGVPRYQHRKLDPVSKKADGPPLGRAASLDNRAGGAACFADESPDGARLGGAICRSGGARAGDGSSVGRRRGAGRGRG
jgi:hypothetical protein